MSNKVLAVMSKNKLVGIVTLWTNAYDIITKDISEKISENIESKYDFLIENVKFDVSKKLTSYLAKNLSRVSIGNYEVNGEIGSVYFNYTIEEHEVI